ITYTVVAQIAAGASGNLVNTVNVSHPADGNPANNSATDTDQPNPQADLRVTKDDGRTFYIPGGTLVYTIVVTNLGPAPVTGATVVDILPPQIASASWTCTPSGAGATCTPSGSGNINDTVNLPVGAWLTYTVNATISHYAMGPMVNTVTVNLPAGMVDPTPANNAASDVNQRQDMEAIPTLGPAGFATLLLMVALLGLYLLQQRKVSAS
ncbi:MAG: DUF11 domain-containing protein, partial [Thermoanaerobaculum sp.]|nr:DUF11 domain-containing protein [Thermoanaerobaculum sp.]